MNIIPRIHHNLVAVQIVFRISGKEERGQFSLPFEGIPFARGSDDVEVLRRVAHRIIVPFRNLVQGQAALFGVIIGESGAGFSASHTAAQDTAIFHFPERLLLVVE